MYFAILRSDDGRYWWRAVGDNNEVMAASQLLDDEAERRALDCDRAGRGSERAGTRPERRRHAPGLGRHQSR